MKRKKKKRLEDIKSSIFEINWANHNEIVLYFYAQLNVALFFRVKRKNMKKKKIKPWLMDN